MTSLKGLNLLIAEDFEDTQELLRILFESEGAIVTIADNGLEALVRARLEPFDLILMDLDMPEMDGMEAARKLREGGYQGLIVALSASAENGAERPSDDFSFQANKPLTGQDLARIKSEALRVEGRSADTVRTVPRSDDTHSRLRVRFLESLATQERNLHSYLVEGNDSAVGELAHKLRGIGTMAGFPEITAAAAAVETGSAEGGVLLEVIRDILQRP